MSDSQEYRREFKAVEKQVRWSGLRIFVLILLFTFLCGAGGWIYSILSTPAAVVSKVFEPDKIIFNYEWFHETYEDVQALDKQVITAQKAVDDFTAQMPTDRTQWGREDKIEQSRLNAIAQGLRNQRDSVVAEYNAKSKMLTRKLFKDSNLPFQLTVVNDHTIEAAVE